MEFRNKNILIVGMARSGIAAAHVLKELGAKVTVNDIKPYEEVKKEADSLRKSGVVTVTGGHPLKILENKDFIVVSPGVPVDIPLLEEARKKNISIYSEIEIGYRLTQGKIIAITGTNGKTTTTTLAEEILKNSGIEAIAAGNIGIPLIQVARKVSSDGYLVVEVSSFQLQEIEKFKPKISVILNLTKDHLNRHKTFENYVEAKARIFENQEYDDYTVLNEDDALVKSFASKTRGKTVFFSRKKHLDYGVFVKNNVIVVKDFNSIYPVCRVEEIGIKGSHNLENALACVAIGWLCGVNFNNMAETLKDFRGVEHRLEYVDTVGGVKFINDSKGTNPEAAMKAIEAVDEPIVLIAGGKDKGSDFEEFVKAFENKVRAMIVLGETAEKLTQTAKAHGFRHVIKVKSIQEAVEKSFQLAKPGWCVLLSPACASWDMFESFEERGNVFKESVKSLRRKNNVS